MKKHIFKEGDKVFSLVHGWGVVLKTDLETLIYNVTCSFFDRMCDYTIDGKSHPRDLHPTLSHTEYKLDGFSQYVSIDLPEAGETILVCDHLDYPIASWYLRVFEKYDHGDMFPVNGLFKHFKRFVIK
jgi:hypothetical protein